MKLVVLSRNPSLYSTQRLVEVGQKRGHEVLVVDHLKCDLIIEKRKPAIVYRNELLKNVDAVIPRIGASVTFYGTAVVRQFDMMKVFSALESQAFVRFRDELRRSGQRRIVKVGLVVCDTMMSHTFGITLNDPTVLVNRESVADCYTCG